MVALAILASVLANCAGHGGAQIVPASNKKNASKPFAGQNKPFPSMVNVQAPVQGRGAHGSFGPAVLARLGDLPDHPGEPNWARDHARPEKADPTATLTLTPGNEIISDEVSYLAGGSGEVTASPAILARRSASAGLNPMSIIQGGSFTGTDDIDLPGATDGTQRIA